MSSGDKIRLNRIPGFIIIHGLLCGLVLSFNLWLINFIGYGAIYTNLIFTFLLFLFFIKSYKWIIGTEIGIASTLAIGFPAFLLGLAIYKVMSDFGATIRYTDFGRQELIKEWFGYAALMTGMLGLVILPIYRWTKRTGKKEH